MLMEDIIIRQASAVDLNKIVPLLQKYLVFYGRSCEVEKVESFLQARLEKRDSVIFIAEASHQPIAMMQLYPSFSTVALNSIWILNDLYVVPDYRRCGVGRKMLEAAVHFAKSEGAVRLDLKTAHDNEAAMRLYEEFGFMRDAHFTHYQLKIEE